MLLLLLLLGLSLQFDWPWFTGLAIAAGLFAWQQYLVIDRQREACFKAFMNNNWVGLVIWVGLLADYFIV